MSTGVELARAVDHIASEWRADRARRQARRHLDRADFALLRDAGLLAAIAPADAGGLTSSIATAVRPLCALYRQLAAADPSVALVSSMHPAVIAFWLATSDPAQPAWEEQRRAVFAGAVAGEQWGTITSEPGSGGDIARTRAVADPAAGDGPLPGATYAVTGEKHFGSGLGVTDRMMTTAIPAGESAPTIFVLDVADTPWDGTAGLTLTAEWDGAGMAATQSHGMHLGGAVGTRLAWAGPLDDITRAAGPFIQSLFTAVILGVVDEAVAVAGEQVRRRSGTLRAYERVEWSQAALDHWLATQAYEGALRAVESGDPRQALRGPLCAKQAVADLAERTLLRLSRVLGGGTFSLRSPFAHWFEDVRALGFLRPPWGLADDILFASSLE